jgi:hypothetical protein
MINIQMYCHLHLFEDQWNAATHFYMTYEGHLLTQLPVACITHNNIAHSH